MALTIGELGKATTTKVETIRYYERIGLLPKPDRTISNYRAYSRPELDRLSFIRRARDLGFTLHRVRDLLALADRREQSCATVDALATAHLAEVERKIADLQALQLELGNLLAQCRRGVIANCRIIEALGPTRTNTPDNAHG